MNPSATAAPVRLELAGAAALALLLLSVAAVKKAGITGVRIDQQGDIFQMQDSFARIIRAIGGLLIGTILTLIYIPMFAYSVEKKQQISPQGEQP